MDIIHLYGPFVAGYQKKIELAGTYNILQMGVETLHSAPMCFYTTTDTYNGRAVPPLLKIDDREFAIMDNDILEFDGLFQNKMTITFLKAINPYTVVNLVFKDVDA